MTSRKKGIMLGSGNKVTVICKRGKKGPQLTQDGYRQLVTIFWQMAESSHQCIYLTELSYLYAGLLT
jgi:hypothetical protein